VFGPVIMMFFFKLISFVTTIGFSRSILRRIGVYEMNKNDFINNIKENSNEVDMSLLKKPIILSSTLLRA
jgi:hypothetical protein